VENSSQDESERPQNEPFIPDSEIQLTARDSQVELLAGRPTRVMKYDAVVLSGNPAVLQAIPSSYLGPILRVRRGQKLRVRLRNRLQEPTTIHWHGLHVPSRMDGHPRDAISPGESYTYDFEIKNRAGTYWFHPHPHGRTGFQVYAGLAGLLIVSDEEEEVANLPSGEFEIPLIIQDRSFDRDNQLVYISTPMDQMSGFLGDRILVNGRPDFTLNAATRAYRLRLLNGSNSRVYKLAWEDRTPMMVLATDGGLLERPAKRDYVFLAPGERIELWADFSNLPVGGELRLKSLAFSGAESGMMGMMGGMMGRGMMRGMMQASSFPQGTEFTVLRVRIDRAVKANADLPATLSRVDRYRLEQAENSHSPRTFEIGMRGMMAWGINGRTFEMEGVAREEIVKLGALEAWEFVNAAGGMGAMVHPMHIHGVQFQVVSRQMDPALQQEWNAVRAGYVDEGWKDTVLLWPGERVRLLMKFEDFPGLFLYHCHNLEHEDSGLMRNYRIEA
jgi:FtsP/CotA-like multicopper oxidase with cupredoxin domain